MPLRVLGVLLVSIVAAGCVNVPDLKIPSDMWQYFYAAELYRNQAIADVRYLAGVSATLDQIGQDLTTAGPAPVNCAQLTQAPSSPAADYCRAQAAAQVAYAGARDDFDAARQDYNDAQAKWNAWIGTIVLVLTSNSRVEDWPAYATRAQEANKAATAFVETFPQRYQARLAMSKLDALAVTARSLRDQKVQASAGGATGRGAAGSATATASASSGGVLLPGLPIDPLKIIDMINQAQTQRALLSTEARARMVGELERRTWPDYDCILGAKICSIPQTTQPAKPADPTTKP